MIARKFKRAVTDSESEVRYDPRDQARRQQPARDPRRGHRPVARPTWPRGYTQYGPLKTDAGDAVIELLTPIQARYRELLDDPGELAVAAAHRLGEGPRRGLGDAAAGLRRHRPRCRA